MDPATHDAGPRRASDVRRGVHSMDGPEPRSRGLLARAGGPVARARVVGGGDQGARSARSYGVWVREQPLRGSQSGVSARASAPVESTARPARPTRRADVAVLILYCSRRHHPSAYATLAADEDELSVI